MATIYPRPPPSASSPMAAREDSVHPPIREVAAETKISVECGHDVAGGVRVKWIEPDPIDETLCRRLTAHTPIALLKGIALVMPSC